MAALPYQRSPSLYLLSHRQAPVLTVENEEPYAGTEVYLRGGFNGWGTDTPLIYQGSRQYQVAMSLTAGSYEFKVASEDWATVNLGAISGADADKQVMVGATTYLAATNDNLVLTIEEDGDYVFVLDATDKAEPVLKYSMSNSLAIPRFICAEA